MSDQCFDRVEKRKREIAKSKKEREIIIGLYPLNQRTKSLLLDGQIYVQHSLEKEEKIKAFVYSSHFFETPNEPYTNPLNSHYVLQDSNFVNGKETMPYDEFIEILARLNNIKKIKDYTLQQGISAIEELVKKGL